MPPRARRTADHGLLLPAPVAAQIREGLPRVADEVVAAIIEEVPSYTDAFGGPMGETIRNAVQLALGGFLTLATRDGESPPMAPALAFRCRHPPAARGRADFRQRAVGRRRRGV